MCGIFGAVRCGVKTDESFATTNRVFFSLGMSSEERGRDSSGIAAVIDNGDRNAWTAPLPGEIDANMAVLDDCLVVKNTVSFEKLDFTPAVDWLLDARVLLGHTRAATQGSADQVKNASPIFAGALLGTHNGDVEKMSLPSARMLRKVATGDTDTEMLYLALHLARNDRRKMTSVLRGMHGRAALVFVDRARSDRLYLARTALSPLAFAYDTFGNFYYASNPDWFRRIELDHSHIEFGEITMVPEGVLMTLNTVTGEVEDVRRFTPTCRERDIRVINSAVYRGFLFEDKAADMTLHRHKVVRSGFGKVPGFLKAPVIAPVAEEALVVIADAVPQGPPSAALVPVKSEVEVLEPHSSVYFNKSRGGYMDSLEQGWA